MSEKTIYSVCGMCSVRCPIQAHVEDGACTFLQGNPFVKGIDGAICARGGAGLALVNDDERPRGPLIRDGERGEGKWRAVEWEEALDYVADNLRKIMDTHGGRSILFSDRGGPFKDLHQAFVRGLGSPNYCNHDVSCSMNVQNAALSVFGIGRKELINDYRNAGHVVLQTRNIFESINVKEVNDLLAGMEQGCKLTVIDIRGTVTASKADRFLLIRPGTDYAFNLAIIHLILRERLHDEFFARHWIKDLDRLEEFVRPYTPEWAERETGIPATEMVSFIHDFSKSAPAAVWHPGWMTARYRDSFHVCRSIYLINAPSRNHRGTGRHGDRKQTGRRWPQGTQKAGGPGSPGRGTKGRRRRVAISSPGIGSGAIWDSHSRHWKRKIHIPSRHISPIGMIHSWLFLTPKR